MRIVFSDHARVKILQRSIPRNFILLTLDDPGAVLQGREGKLEYIRKFKKLFLKVIVERSEEKIVVVTVHWVAKLPPKR